MKRTNIVIVFFLCLTFTGCCKHYDVEARVIAINNNILQGQLIGRILSSPDGIIQNDVNKVSVEIDVEGVLLLVELKLSHAELVYHKNATTLPITLIVHNNVGPNNYRIILHGRCVYYGQNRNL